MLNHHITLNPRRPSLYLTIPLQTSNPHSMSRFILNQSFHKSKHLLTLSCNASANTGDTVPSRKDDETEVVKGVSETIVGVLGGGQLGRMLCQAASQLAIKVSVLDPLDNCPASSLSYEYMVGSFGDNAAVSEFANRCGVMTFEIEHVDVTTLEKLEKQGVDCQPKASTVLIIQIHD